MRKSIVFIVLNFLFLIIFGNEKRDAAIFKQANDAYDKGEYATSLQLYKRLNNNNIVFYNMANAYLKLGDTVRGILNFERALKINPNNKDARKYINNLELINLSYKTDIKKAVFLNNTFGNVFPNHSNAFAYLLIIVFWCSVLFLYLAIKSYLKERKVIFYCLSIFLFISAVFVFNLTYKTYQIEQNTKSAIVIKPTILKEQAHLLSNNVVQFPKGLKVYIKEKNGDWKKVLFADGNSAWIEKSSIEEI
jgi:tetratricopeptide (TPR) repeat protein